MSRLTIAIIASLISAAAIGGVYVAMINPEPVPAAATGFDASADLADRVLALEQALAEEREARQLLEDELFALIAEMDEFDTVDREPVQQTSRVEPAATVNRMTQRRDWMNRFSPEGREQALLEAGFTPDRAEWLARRESELRMQVMQERFEARRNGEMVDPFSDAFSSDAMLRNEIGDAEYEQYLEASNRPTSVAIQSVLESSPAQSAGLQPGDRITSYDGERIFNVLDLNRQTIQGEPGQTVVVDIVRDGVPMQVVMPRGPLGVMAGRGR